MKGKIQLYTYCIAVFQMARTNEKNIEAKGVKTVSENETKKATKKEVKTIKFIAWVRNKSTNELEEIEVLASNVADVAKLIRSEGKYSFRTAAIPEKIEDAKKKWIEMNAKSIAYHAKKNSSNKASKMKRLIELISDLPQESKDEIYEMFNLKNYE